MDDQTTYFFGLALLLIGGWNLYAALRDRIAFSGYGAGGAKRTKHPVIYWITVAALAGVPLAGLAMMLKLFFPHPWD